MTEQEIVTILSVDTDNPQYDGNGSDRDMDTAIRINFDKREISVGPTEKYEYGEREVFEGKEWLQSLRNRPDEAALTEYLESAATQKLLGKICDTGKEQLLQQLLNDIERLPESTWHRWMVDEWIGNSHDVEADTTDEDIKKQAGEIEQEATKECVVLSGDVEDYLRQIRDDLQKR